MPRETGRLPDRLREGQGGDKRLKNVIEDMLTLLGMVIKFIYSYGKLEERRKSNLNAEFSQGNHKWLALTASLKVNRMAGGQTEVHMISDKC